MARLSYNDRRGAVQTALAQNQGDGWIMDLYDDTAIYAQDTGGLMECAYTINPDTLEVKLGTATPVAARTEYVPLVAPAIYSLPAAFSTEGDRVRRQGKIFEVGTYPAQQFSLTEAEADAAIAGFQPVPLEVEHFATKGQPSIFDGKLGHLTRVWRQGKDLYGEVEVPAWADAPWGEWGRKVSTVWNRATKSLERCGLVINPAVGDAAMMAAFAAQQPTPHTLKERTMTWLEDLRALLTRADAPTLTGANPVPATPTTSPAPAPAPVPTFSAVPAPAPAPAPVEDPNLTAAFARIAELEAISRRTEATNQVARLQAAGKIPSWEVPFAVETLVRDMTDDAQHPAPATFSLPGATTPVTLTRAQLTIAGWEQRPTNGLLGEAIPAALFGANPGTPAQSDDMATTLREVESYLAENPRLNR